MHLLRRWGALGLGVALIAVGCKSTDSTETPPKAAIVNRSNLAYTFGVVAFTTPTRTDTLTHSTGDDSVCVAMPAAGNAFEVFYGLPADTANPHLETQVFIGSEAPGWELYFGPKAAGNDTLEVTLSATVGC